MFMVSSPRFQDILQALHSSLRIARQDLTAQGLELLAGQAVVPPSQIDQGSVWV
jgi:hypothetical protein